MKVAFVCKRAGYMCPLFCTINILPPQPAKSVRFLTDEDFSLPRRRTSSWSSGNQVPSNSRPGPSPLEVWAPSLTLGRDGPGIILKEGKGPVLRKGLDKAISDLNSVPQKQTPSQPLLSAVSAQFSPSRYVEVVCVCPWKWSTAINYLTDVLMI